MPCACTTPVRSADKCFVDRLRALRLLKLRGEVGNAEVAAVCDAWEFAYSLRASSAPDPRRRTRYRRLAAAVADARRALLGTDATPENFASSAADAGAPALGARHSNWIDRCGLTVGATVAGRFELLAPRGECNLGCVFDARDRGTPRTLEVLSPALDGYPAARERYLSAARAVQALGEPRAAEHDPALARVYDVFHWNGLTLASMEALPRHTLREQISRRRRHRRAFSPAEVRSVVARVANLLSDAASRGVLATPRPEFIWLRDDGTIRLLHFGISSALSEARSPVPAAAYAPPESLSRGAPTDPAALQYMLGVLACELLTGEPPHGSAVPPALPAPPEMSAAVARALARRPDDRFPCLRDFAAALGPVRASGADAPPRDAVEKTTLRATHAPSRTRTAPDSPQPAPARARNATRRAAAMTLVAVVSVLVFHPADRAAAPIAASYAADAAAARQRPEFDAAGPVVIAGSGHADDEPAPAGEPLATIPPAAEPPAAAPVPAADEVRTPPARPVADGRTEGAAEPPPAPPPIAVAPEPAPDDDSDAAPSLPGVDDPAREPPPFELTVLEHPGIGGANAARTLSRAVFPMSFEEAAAVQQSTARRHARPVFRRLDLGPAQIELALVPEGDFLMGSPPYERGRFDDEGPLRPVTIRRAFYLGRTEVTVAHWRAVMGPDAATTPQVNGGDDDSALPAVNISWDEAADFCRRLGELTRERVRLPTEAEWEYACRAGRASAYFTGETLLPGDATFDLDGSIALLAADLSEARIAVAALPPNAWGLFDMHGGVCEWCADAYRYAAASPPTLLAADPGPRVVRGGSWATSAAYCRSAARARLAPSARRPDLGFRIVVDIEPPETPP